MVNASLHIFIDEVKAVGIKLFVFSAIPLVPFILDGVHVVKSTSFLCNFKSFTLIEDGLLNMLFDQLSKGRGLIHYKI